MLIGIKGSIELFLYSILSRGVSYVRRVLSGVDSFFICYVQSMYVRRTLIIEYEMYSRNGEGLHHHSRVVAQKVVAWV